MDLAGLDLEIDMTERLHAGKRLRDLLQPEHQSPQAQWGWQGQSMIRKMPAPDLIRGGYRFSEKIMLHQRPRAR
jgi:hypothetical protein